MFRQIIQASNSTEGWIATTNHTSERVYVVRRDLDCRALAMAGDGYETRCSLISAWVLSFHPMDVRCMGKTLGDSNRAAK